MKRLLRRLLNAMAACACIWWIDGCSSDRVSGPQRSTGLSDGHIRICIEFVYPDGHTVSTCPDSTKSK